MIAGVHLNDWFHLPGGSYMVLIGEVEYVKAEDFTGGDARPRGEQNYLVRITGETETIEVFGCQVRGLIRGAAIEKAIHEPLERPSPSWYLVR